MIVEQRSYETDAAILFVGFLFYGALMIWINLCRMAGLGYFPSARSDRVAKRHQCSLARRSTSANADWHTNGS